MKHLLALPQEVGPPIFVDPDKIVEIVPVRPVINPDNEDFWETQIVFDHTVRRLRIAPEVVIKILASCKGEGIDNFVTSVG